MKTPAERDRTNRTAKKRAPGPASLTEEAVFRNVREYMAGLANSWDLQGHVHYFQQAIPNEISTFLSLTKGEAGSEMEASRACHKFCAWTRLYPELICNMAMAKLSRNELCQMGPAQYRFEDLATMIPDRARAYAIGEGRFKMDRIEGWIRSFKLVIEFRHCLQHGGLPRSIRKKAAVLGYRDLEEVAQMSIPQNFERTKQIFQEARLLLNLLPQKTVKISQGPKVRFD